MVTHDTELIPRFSRCLHISDGELVDGIVEATPQEEMESPIIVETDEEPSASQNSNQNKPVLTNLKTEAKQTRPSPQFNWKMW